MLMNMRRGRSTSATVKALAPLLLVTTALVSVSAYAGDLTITSSRTDPVTTSNADGAGPGNLTVNSGATIAVTTPTAVTLDSNNTITNNGSISTSVESGATGVNIFTTQNGVANFLAGSITNTGTIAAAGPASDSALVNTDVLNAGIRLNGLGSFTGDIANSGTIAVGGNASHAIWISAPMIGTINNSGTLSTTGSNNAGIYTTAPITGSILNTGTISGSGAGAMGLYVGNSVSGTITHSGTISVGQAPTYSTTDINPVTGIGAIIPQVSSTAGMWIAGNVNQGIHLTGNSYTKAQEAANTSIDTTGDSTITAIGGPGILVQPGGGGGYQNVTIGALTDSTYSILNNANLSSTSYADGVNAIAIDVKGATDSNGVTYTASLPGGIGNIGGDIVSASTNATAIALHVGSGGSVKELYNTGDISVLSSDNTADNSRGLVGTKGGPAYGVLVEPGGSLTSFTNTGNLTVRSQGPNSSYGVVDQSGTLTTFYNSGKITPIIDQLSTGSITAVDLSANTTGVNFTNTGTGIITGPVKLGSGTNIFTMDTAQQLGNVSFVGGTNTLNITTSTISGNVALGNSNSTMTLVNSTINGALGFTTGSLNLTSRGSTINTPTGSILKLTNGTFDSTSNLLMGLTGTTTGNGTLVATGNVSFANGAKITPVFNGIATTPTTVNLVTSGNLTLGSSVNDLVASNVSFVNKYTVQADPANANNIQLTVTRRTTGEMGLNPNMSAAFNASVTALNKDPEVAAAVLAPATRDGFLSAFRQLLPDTSDATRQIALAAQDLSLGAVRSRLTGIPDQRSGADGDRSSFWLQAIGNGLSAGRQGDDLGYGDWGVGIALGIDTPLSSTTKVGINVTEMFNNVDFGVSPNSQLFVYGSQLNFYGRQDLGRFYMQGMVGGALNKYEGTRNIRIGTLKRTADGRGNGNQYGGTIELGAEFGVGAYNLDPYIRAQYLKLHQGLYQDTGGGDGVNLTVDPHTQTSLKGSTGIAVNRDYIIGIDSTLQATVRGNYSHEFMYGQNLVTSRFTSDSTPFTNSILLHGPDYYSAGFSIGHKDSFSSITLDYDGEATGKYTAHTATVNLRFRL